MCFRTKRIFPYEEVHSVILCLNRGERGIFDNRSRTVRISAVSKPTDMAAWSEGFVMRYSCIRDGLSQSGSKPAHNKEQAYRETGSDIAIRKSCALGASAANASNIL